MSDTTSYRILLAGYGESDVSADLPHLFKRTGCTVELYCPKRSWLTQSRYQDAWHPANTRSQENYAEGLAYLVTTSVYDWIVLTDDAAVRSAHDYLPDEVKNMVLPVLNKEHRAVAGSKAALSLFCQKYAIPTPSFVVYDGTKSIEECARGLSFPLLLKEDRSSGGRGVHYCATEQELKTRFSSLSLEQQKNLLVQTYISGDNVPVEALYRSGELIAYTQSRVVQTLGGEFGVSSVREYVSNTDLEPHLIRLGSLLGIHGFCNGTYIREHSSGTYYLIEADLRTNAWLGLARFSGVDFSVAIKHYLDKTPGCLRQPEGPPVCIRHFSRDLLWSIRNKDWKNVWYWISNKEQRWRYIPLHEVRIVARIIFSALGAYGNSFKVFRYIKQVLRRLARRER